MNYKSLTTLAIMLTLGQSIPTQAGLTATTQSGTQNPSSLQGAKDFIEKMGRDAIKSLTRSGVSQTDLETEFQKFLEKDFDVPGIARFVMGNNWGKLSVPQQKRFIPLFEQRLKKTYANRFQQYQGVEFKVLSARQQQGHIRVHTTIQKPGGPITPVDWDVQNEKVHDVKIEGVSMTMTIRDEYREAFKGGVEQFLNSLENVSKIPG